MKPDSVGGYSQQIRITCCDQQGIFRKERFMCLVYVLAPDGKPLMPCVPAIARLLLKEEKAKVVQRKPFRIKLLGNGYWERSNWSRGG